MQTHIVVYMDCLTPPDTEIASQLLIFPYRRNSCALLCHPSRKPWCIKKPFPTRSASRFKLKNPFITLVILQYYEISSGLISIYLDYFPHPPEHSVHFTLDFILALVFCTKYQHHMWDPSEPYWCLLFVIHPPYKFFQIKVVIFHAQIHCVLFGIIVEASSDTFCHAEYSIIDFKI